MFGVKGLEMPCKCYECIFAREEERIYGNAYTCFITRENITESFRCGLRDEHCPFFPIKETKNGEIKTEMAILNEEIASLNKEIANMCNELTENNSKVKEKTMKVKTRDLDVSVKIKKKNKKLKISQ